MGVTDEIRARINAVDFISPYIEGGLKRSGRSHSGKCPFHSESHGSFHVFDDGRWRCFGACGEGGDIFDFIQKKEGLSFPDALEKLAGIAGVELPKREQEKDYSRLYEVHVEASLWFHEQLRQPVGRAAFQYIKERGFTVETIKAFRMGFAPNDWKLLTEYLTAKGFTETELIESGISIKHEKSGRVYDRFRNRVIIPISDPQGRVIAFGGRIMPGSDDNAKYLNSPQTPLFDKGRTLFPLHAAQKAIREAQSAVIVEGYMDALIAHQAGFANVVSPLGTAIGADHLKVLSRMASDIVLALDADAAGVNAAQRGINTAAAILRQSSRLLINMRVLVLPADTDPDELILANADNWRNGVREALPADDYIIQEATRELPASAIERERLATRLVPVLHAIERDVQRDMALQKLAARLQIGEKAILTLIDENRPSAPPPSVEIKRGSQPERLLSLLLGSELRVAMLNRVFNQHKIPVLTGEDFPQPYRDIFEAWKQAISGMDEADEYMRSHLDATLITEYEEMLIPRPLPDLGFRIETKDKPTPEKSILYLAAAIRRVRLEREIREYRLLADSESATRIQQNLNQISALVRVQNGL